MKIGGGVGKIILRDLLHKTFPKELFHRPKAGFAVPLGDWMRNKLKPWAADLLNPAALEADGNFNTASIGRMWVAHIAGRGDFAEPLWSVLMFRAWQMTWR